MLYVGETGGYTNVKPTGGSLIQNLGIVLKSHPSNGSGIVYGAGRSNDVPNLPDGKFFIGSATNTQESTYGLPTSDPSDGQTLVYDSSSDAFVGGYPTSNGQRSTFTAAYNSSTPSNMDHDGRIRNGVRDVSLRSLGNNSSTTGGLLYGS